MANKTVYPYGTEGRLPSSIGLVNDLITGGVDKALTAEQGKFIGNEVFGAYNGYKELPDWIKSRPSGTGSTKRVFMYNSEKVYGGEIISVKLSDYTKYKFSIVITDLRTSVGATVIYSSSWYTEDTTYTVPEEYGDNYIRVTYAMLDGDDAISDSAFADADEERILMTPAIEKRVENLEEAIAGASGNAKREISILFIGNSLTQDAVSYVPFLIRNLYPDIHFRFYMWYNGGYTLGQQYTKFTSNGNADIFSVCENKTSWTNYNNSKTMASVLSTYQFDIVCLQEYFNYKETYTDVTDFNNCVSYIKSNYPHEFKVVTLFHAPLRASADSVFALTKSGNELILKQTVAESLLAPGVAVYRALSTDLDSLGDQGHLSPDGTHTQEGLPCLLQAFVVYLWILRQLSVPCSVYNCQLRMTTSIYSSISVPGPNLGTGVIEGTDAQNLLAQDVAIKADKEGQGYQMSAFISFDEVPAQEAPEE